MLVPANRRSFACDGVLTPTRLAGFFVGRIEYCHSLTHSLCVCVSIPLSCCRGVHFLFCFLLPPTFVFFVKHGTARHGTTRHNTTQQGHGSHLRHFGPRHRTVHRRISGLISDLFRLLLLVWSAGRYHIISYHTYDDITAVSSYGIYDCSIISVCW